MENEKYVLEKSIFMWVKPFLIAGFCALVGLCSSDLDKTTTIVWLAIAIVIILHTLLRWQFDKIEYSDGFLNSRIGIISIDKKSIPLNKISMVSEQTNIIAQLFGFGDILVQSSAASSDIKYKYIDKPQDFVKFMNEKLKGQ